LRNVPEEIDLVCVLIPFKSVLSIIEESVEKKAKSAIVFASGFAEMGEERKKLQDEIVRRAREGGLRLCGPNCIGVISPAANLYASFSQCLEVPPIKGDVAFLSQSGALGGSILTRMWDENIGISHFISSGNEADLDTADYLAYLAQDPDTKVICIFMEGILNGRKFMRACKVAGKNGKPVIILKTGRSKKGKFSATSHTGAIAGSDEVYEALFKQVGAIRARTIDEFIKFPMVFAWQPLPKGKKVGVISTSGGACSIVADELEDAGLDLPNFSEETIDELEKILPPFIIIKNPMDTTAQMINEPELFKKSIEMIARDKSIDVILIVLTTALGSFAERLAEDIAYVAKTIRELGKPIIVSWLVARSYIPKPWKLLSENKIPTYPNLEEATKQIKAIFEYQEFLKKIATKGVLQSSTPKK